MVNALLVPSRAGFAFQSEFEGFTLEGVEGLYIENDVMEPVQVTVQHLKSNTNFELTIIGVLDEFTSSGGLILPAGLFTSSNTLAELLPEEIDATQFFFNTVPGVEDADEKIEAAFFEHGLQTLDLQEAIADFQAQQRSFFNLVLAFMALGLVVGIAALGVISARAVADLRAGDSMAEGSDHLCGGVRVLTTHDLPAVPASSRHRTSTGAALRVISKGLRSHAAPCSC